MAILDEISLTLQQGAAWDIQGQVQQALDEGIAAKDILEQGLLAGMNIIGAKFKNNEVFLPEVLMAARAMNMGVDVLKPFLGDGEIAVTGRVAIGTVRGDLHDIGKNLVKLMLEGKGFEVIDLGTDVPAEKFVEAVRDQGCTVIGMSALLTTTMLEMAEVIKALEAAGLRDKVTVMVGGAPVTEDFCRQIGADIYTADAASCADAAVAACLK